VFSVLSHLLLGGRYLGSAPVAEGRTAVYASLMATAFDEPRPPLGDALTDEERRREEAAREFTEWLFEGRPLPTDEELEAVAREWQD